MKRGKCIGDPEILCQSKSWGGFGFRKLAEFNKALLAKQVWRLSRNPSSLAARVLKDRYFRHGSVLDASLGSSPSYIWRSLLWSRDLLMDGLLWRVGNGTSIRIFEDKWIPSMHSKFGDPLVPWEREDTVIALIKEGGCDTELIADRFNPYVTGEILKIPLSAVGTCDSLFWRYDAKGKYEVIDGCRLQHGLFSAPDHQSVHPNEEWWSFIWSLSVPPKVRLFWWSISLDCIPTNQNLLRHHVLVNESCDLCNFPRDSTCHALFFCAAIKHLWKNTSFSLVLRGTPQTCTMELCLRLKEQLSKTEFEDLAIHTWAVWREKQNYLHGDRKKPLAENVSWSSAILYDFRKARAKEKIVDVSKRGNPEKINQPISVVYVELLAIREGIILLYDKGFSDVQVASDSLLAVQVVTIDQEDLGYTGLCAEILEHV